MAATEEAETVVEEKVGVATATAAEGVVEVETVGAVAVAEVAKEAARAKAVAKGATERRMHKRAPPHCHSAHSGTAPD